MRSFLLAAALAFASTGLPVQAQETNTLVLQPSGPWNLDYGDTRCRLAGAFGEGEHATAFWIEQTGPSSGFSWVLAGGAVEKLGPNRGIEVRFGTNFDPIEVNLPERPGERRDGDRTKLTLDGFGKAIMGFGYRQAVPPPEGSPPIGESVTGLDPKDGALIDHVEFVRDDRRVRLATGPLGEAFEAMNECTRNLYASWGVTFEEIALAATGARPLNMADVAKRIRQTYPAKALRRGEQATVGLKLLIAADGTVQRCIRFEVTKAKNFGNEPCEIMVKHARFEPARDATGKPVRGFYQTTVSYWM